MSHKGSLLIKKIKNIFIKSKQKEKSKDSPGRTFKRVLTGRYFGCEDMNATDAQITQAKKEKLEQIHELELIPMYIKYTHEHSKEKRDDNDLVSAHVAFQKEILAEKWNMVHVTEISFTIHRNDFEEFEKMSGVRLNDFKDVTPDNNTGVYQGVEKRKITPRD